MLALSSKLQSRVAVFSWCLQFLCALDLDHRSVSDYNAWLTRVSHAARLKKWYGHGRTGRTGAYGHDIYYCSTCTYIVLPTSCSTGLTKLFKVGNKGMRSAKRSCGSNTMCCYRTSENMESCADDCPLCCKLSCGVV